LRSTIDPGDSSRLDADIADDEYRWFDIVYARITPRSLHVVSVSDDFAIPL